MSPKKTYVFSEYNPLRYILPILALPYLIPAYFLAAPQVNKDSPDDPTLYWIHECQWAGLSANFGRVVKDQE